MSVYDPYSRYSMYGVPSVRSSYYSYGASPYGMYSNPYSTTMMGGGAGGTGVVSERIYFSLNGKLIRSYKIRNYRRAQKHVLNLYPDRLSGVASSRIQFFVTRPAYSQHGQYVGFKSYMSKHTWRSEVDSLAEHETVGVEVRPSISFTESVSSFFNRSRFL